MPKPVLTLPSAHARASSHRASLLVFEDLRSQALLERLRLVAPSLANVVVIGETGTGKELVARHIHELSSRASGPFCAVNCGAFSENLVESELFGHERGAFTGALNAKAGWFEAASGGTLFLDEIGELPLHLQVKLLRVLQERQVVRLGAREPIEIDVRVVAATNIDLEEAVSAGRFREDLYFRLSVATLHVPPLRDRRGDILPLAHHFLRDYAVRLGIPKVTLSPGAEQQLLNAHSWPGNIRELENVIHHALLVHRGNVIRPEDLNLSTLRAGRSLGPTPTQVQNLSGTEQLSAALRKLYEEEPEQLHGIIEDVVIRTAFEYCYRNQVQTARLLGISRNIVRARLAQCGEIPPTRRKAPASSLES